MHDRLSIEQEHELQEFSARWLNPCRPAAASRESVEAALNRLYGNAGFKAPGIFWCSSIFQSVVARALLAVLMISDEKDDIRERLRTELTDPNWSKTITLVETYIDSFGLPQRNDNPENKQCSIQDLLGQAWIGNESFQKITKAISAVEPQISLRVKLQLREAFVSPNLAFPQMFAGNGILRGAFGVAGLRNFVYGEPAADFAKQLKDETRLLIEERCKAHLVSSHFSFLNRIGGQPENPIALLFATLSDVPTLPSNFEGIAAFAYLLRHLEIDLEDELRRTILDWLTIEESVFDVSFYEHFCVLIAAPLRAELDANMRLHNGSGPAMEFSNGELIYAWNGMRLPAVAIEEREKLQVKDIEKEQNIELRRVLIQLYGLERYLEDSGAVQIDADETGVLYKKVETLDEPLVVVKVINQTPEADGSRKFYFLRVPPYMTSARAAVAWTFNMEAAEYEPVLQS